MRTRPARVLASLAAATTVAAGLTACTDAGDGDPSTLTVGVTTPSWNAGFATLLVSQANGYFAAEGINVKFTLPPSGTQAAQQVIAGGADIALVTPEPVVIGATKGAELSYFASWYRNWIYGLATVEGSEINAVTDLKGKRIGVTNASSSGRTFAQVALQSAGINPDDVEFVPIGVGAQQITAIKDHQVDALALWDTQYQIVRNAGIELKEIPAASLTGMFGGGFVADRDRLDEDPEAFVKFGRAVAKGVVFAQANPEETIKTMWRTRPETAPSTEAAKAQALQEQVKVLQTRLTGLGIPEGATEWGVIDPDRVKDTIEFAKKAALIDEPVEVDEIVDSALIDRINEFPKDEIRKQAAETG